MYSARDRFVVAAILLSESAWLYALIALPGLAARGDGATLSWLAVLAITGSSFMVARGLQFVALPVPASNAIQMLAGAMALYFTLGTQASIGVSGLDLGWIGSLHSDGAPLMAALGGLFGVALWWWGGRLASVDNPVERLEASFRLGVMAMAIGAVFDMFHEADLRVFPLMFLFFASGLTGLAVGHRLPATRRAVDEAAWSRIIGVVVSAVLVSGLLFSLLQRNVLSLVGGALLAVPKGLALVVLYVVIFPISYVVIWIMETIRGLFGEPEVRELQEQIESGGLMESVREVVEGAEKQGPGAWVQVLQWTLVALLIVVVLYILGRAFRRRLAGREARETGTRESVKEDANPAFDLANLLFNLIPDRFRRATLRRSFRLPDDEPGIVDAFRVYFGMLTLAEERGFPRPPTETPQEYQRTLEQVFPRDLVGRATAAFTRACYGHHPASPEQIEEMRTSLEHLASEES